MKSLYPDELKSALAFTQTLMTEPVKGAQAGCEARVSRTYKQQIYLARDKMKLLRISGKSWTAVTSLPSRGRYFKCSS
jgi:hypothetical protein